MSLIFSFPENEVQANSLVKETGHKSGDIRVHHFPDGESNVQILSNVRDEDVILYCSLNQPDRKVMPLMFFSATAKELGARSVTLVAPYLGYMRQDKRFHEGEAITSNIFAAFISNHFDGLITIDPHLHRHKEMREIYSIPTKVIHAADAIAEWIKNNIENPVLIGPDEESDQWVSDVAQKIGAPYTILVKIRRGDKDVEVSIPVVEKYKNHTPVLLDDIISTAHTMVATVKHLKQAGMKSPVCIAVHAVFAGDGFDILKHSGIERIVTCNTITHETNDIDLSRFIALHLKDMEA